MASNENTRKYQPIVNAEKPYVEIRMIWYKYKGKEFLPIREIKFFDSMLAILDFGIRYSMSKKFKMKKSKPMG